MGNFKTMNPTPANVPPAGNGGQTPPLFAGADIDCRVKLFTGENRPALHVDQWIAIFSAIGITAPRRAKGRES